MIKLSDRFYRCVASSLRAAVLDRNNCCCFIAKVKGLEHHADKPFTFTIQGDVF